MIMTEKTIPMYVDDPYNLMLSELRQKSTETRKINTWMPDVIKKLKYGDTAIIFHPGKHLYAFVLAEDHFGWVMKSMIGKIDASD